MSELNGTKHPSAQRMARFAMDNTSLSPAERIAFERHLAECDGCRALYARVRRTPLLAAQPPMLYPALDPGCPRTAELADYDRLPLIQRLSLWAHIVHGGCAACADAAEGLGGEFDVRMDPATESLARRYGARAPRVETPAFYYATAGAADARDLSGQTEVMNATVSMSPRPKKRAYKLTVYRTHPRRPGEFWRVRAQFDGGERLPRGFSMYIYQDGSPDKPLCTSYTGELEAELPEGIYHLNLGNQDHLLIPLVPLPE